MIAYLKKVKRMGKVIKFPERMKWTLCFTVPEEVTMEGSSSDISWTFDNGYGTAEVIAISVDDAKRKICKHIEVDQKSTRLNSSHRT